MGLLAVSNYDPAAAVTKSTAALLAMTAMDAVNLREVFTVPTAGKVLCRLKGVIHGAATMPQILLGVMEGATVIHRQAPQMMLAGTALATTFVPIEVVFVVEGLTAGASKTWDAAYAVETLVAATGIKYGGPNDAVTNNAFGAFCFEVWTA